MDLNSLKNVKKLRRRVKDLLRAKANLKCRQLDSLARASGWEFKGGKGDEPRYEHPRSFGPLTIPNHSRGLAPPTAKSVLSQIDRILFDIEEELIQREGKHEKKN